jgi:hypothetical protein
MVLLWFLIVGLSKVEEKSSSVKRYLSYQVKNLTILMSKQKQKQKQKKLSF